MIDSRLFPLLETLAASNLDWLVSDIIAVVEAGHVQTVSRAAMSSAQERIRALDDARFEGGSDLAQADSRPWSGDEQITVATNIVMTRISETIAMTHSSIETLSRLIADDDAAVIEGLSVEQGPIAGDDETSDSAFDISATRQALEYLGQFRLSVEVWRSEMLGVTESK